MRTLPRSLRTGVSSLPLCIVFSAVRMHIDTHAWFVMQRPTVGNTPSVSGVDIFDTIYLLSKVEKKHRSVILTRLISRRNTKRPKEALDFILRPVIFVNRVTMREHKVRVISDVFARGTFMVTHLCVSI